MTAAARWLGILAIVAFSFEITCRIEDWIRFRTPLLSRFTSPDQLMVRDFTGAHGRPNSAYQKWVMNGLGTRGPGADSVKTQGTFRVLILGASEMFGLYESPNREVARQLEDTLRVRVAALGCSSSRFRRVEVLNAAFPGMSLPTSIQDFRNRTRWFEPDVVIAYPSPAFYLEQNRPDPAPPVPPGTTYAPTWERALAPRSWPRIRDQIKLLVPQPMETWFRARWIAGVRRGQPPDWVYQAVPEDRLAALRDDLRLLAGTVRAIGAVPILTTHGNAFRPGEPGNQDKLIAWQRFHPRATGPTLVAFDSAAATAAFQVAADSGLLVADVAAAVRPLGGLAFADYEHFSDRGAAAAAGALADAVVQSIRGDTASPCR